MSPIAPPKSVLSLLALAPTLLGQGPPGYYNPVNATSAATLRATLHAVIDDHQRFPYTAGSTDTWDILEDAQEDVTNASRILDIYRNGTYAKIGGGVGPYNREHSWPKSYGFPDDIPSNSPYTDCHQLFLSDDGYNTARSNRPYDNANASASELTTVFTQGLGGGSGTFPGNSNWHDGSFTNGRYQAWASRRGDLARAQFYLDVRYEGGTHGGTGQAEPDLRLTDNLSLIAGSNTGNMESVAYMGKLSTLLQWHAADPVDQYERDRNDVVYSYQGNRNPFVDHPEWVDCLFQSQCGGDVTPPVAPIGLVATTSKFSVRLDWADNAEPDLAGYRVYRASTSGGPYTQLTATTLATSAYVDLPVQPGAQFHYVVRAVDTSGNVSANSNEARTFWPLIPAPVAATLPQAAGGPWINELHYNNVGGDVGEFVEIAGPASTNLSGWTLVGYNGANGQVYVTLPLTGSLPNQQNGLGVRAFAMAGLQNGAPDGIALVDAGGTVIEFLAYQGTFTALGGPATGMTAGAIPTGEDDNTPVGFSLQRQGTGGAAAAFTWSVPLPATLGQINTGQTLQ
ncbi:MAG: endonuclease [Planctomycetota bacterium]